MNVLIADDNNDAAESLAIWLRLEGHDVSVAHDGEEALAAFDARPSEVVILDIGMPGLNGYQVAQRIRQGSSDRPVTLIAVTGWGEDDDKARAFAAGFNHHFTRPIEPDRLTELLRPAVPAEDKAEAARPGDAPTEAPTVRNPLTPTLLAGLCHDLRGPLGAIGTWIRVLQSERADAATRLRAVTALGGDVRALAGLIDQVSTLAETLSGPTHVTLSPVDLVPFLQSACASTAEPGPGIEFRSDETSLVGIADAVRLRQIVHVFASLTRNAADGESRELRLTRRGSSAELSVETTGNPRTLDVALARALTEVQGGVLEESLERGTSRFRVLLPLAR